MKNECVDVSFVVTVGFVGIAPCQADNAANCNVEDGGLACVPEFGERWQVSSIVTDLDSPRDVKFHPTPGHHLGDSSEGRTFVTPPNSDEAWVVNGNNHSVSIVPAIDTAYQTTFSRTDRGYFHYMINGTASMFVIFVDICTNVIFVFRVCTI
mmetsp:Transcript_17251/g.36079  ORF Transcript_17251/g.36079 Transcript_17251/m.36079 type:complete len:153 (+) Transcript_17251:285-743(+)